MRSYTDSFHLSIWNNSSSRRSSLTLTHNAMGNAPSLPGLGGGRAHGMRYDDPGGSLKGHRPEEIPAVAMETQAAEQIEEESIGGDSEVEVLKPLEGHKYDVEISFFSVRSHRTRPYFICTRPAGREKPLFRPCSEFFSVFRSSFNYLFTVCFQ